MRGRCAPDRSGSISEARASPSDVTEVEGTTCGGEEIVSGPRYLDEPPRGTSPESEPVRPDGDFFTIPERLLIGGYAVIAHGYPRLTKDIDIWIRPTEGKGLGKNNCGDFGRRREAARVVTRRQRVGNTRSSSFLAIVPAALGLGSPQLFLPGA